MPSGSKTILSNLPAVNPNNLDKAIHPQDRKRLQTNKTPIADRPDRRHPKSPKLANQLKQSLNLPE